MDAKLRPVLRAGAAVLLGAAMAAGCAGGPEPGRPGAGGTGTATVATAQGAVQLEEQYERVIKAVLPSVVQITTDSGEGSGVVYDSAGHIVTNAHVIAGARRIEVVPASGGRPLQASVVGAFVPDDLAVVKVRGGVLPPARFGDSAKLEVGTIVLAMGSPLGLSGSVTNGIVSATGRSVTTGRQGAFPGATIADAIQTSAAINPGNSGGALVTLNGEVIGIPTAAANDPQGGGAAPGIGFATPSNTVTRIVPQLIKDGRVTNSGRAALGVTVRTVADLRSGQPAGVGVVSVTEGGGAQRAGIRPGDVIVRVNGTDTPTQTALSQVLAQLSPGDTVEVVIRPADGAGERTVKVTLGELPGE
ncbi:MULTISPECIES: S1C family serine protease [Thermomonospora]|uniref:PDZ/DHR/GLGF domain protein n=1 Tax=Thermomonospora curvata (strain ATCC 19995 / DSM 43183 / JCM 3096 / KCTC 9072 / NBRC 15933 / NCIMB 10081 / Henssen B9) TaxID=471852 RepID=D1A925_THECD|nr:MULTISPECIES: trypsin-like peptidase domain-containing protein [Thermomonospora]ACY98663.1 PDZ/DHR/GLGF domain protein [Thermomonospora curvata DSM 43183]PKK13788.1 MAG: signal protein PDZ [Thermomonospora sp. CIF 1]